MTEEQPFLRNHWSYVASNTFRALLMFGIMILVWWGTSEGQGDMTIYLAFIYALNRYTVIKEMTTGKGFADVVFIPLYRGDPAMVIELKRNDCTESALNQIRQKQYFDSLQHYKGSMLLIGINYDEKEKTHTCAIERVEKTV